VLELFQNGDQGFPGYTDPCNDPPGAGTLPSAAAAFCISQGVPAGVLPTFAQNNSQVQAFAFGNPNLREETAETSTFGIVFEPDFLPIGDLSLAVDYYKVEIADVVAARGAQTIINSCYGQQNAANPDCARIVRNTVSGQIDSVNTTIGNLASLMTEGVDIQAEYAFDLDEVVKGAPGRLRANLLYTIVDDYEFNGFDFIGTTDSGIGGGLFDWRTVTTINYEVGDWLFQARHTYTPELNTTLWVVNSTNNSPPAEYLDLSARWDVSDALRVTFVVDNVFDEFPPQTIDGTFAQSNTDVQLYRVLGRQLAVSARLKF
jgi:outer membrane receptor protein involved in Fe transport